MHCASSRAGSRKGHLGWWGGGGGGGRGLCVCVGGGGQCGLICSLCDLLLDRLVNAASCWGRQKGILTGQFVRCCGSASTETVVTIRDWGAEDGHLGCDTPPPELCSSMLLYIRRYHIKDCYGRRAQDGHPDFHTAPELSAGQLQAGLFSLLLLSWCFTST